MAHAEQWPEPEPGGARQPPRRRPPTAVGTATPPPAGPPPDLALTIDGDAPRQPRRSSGGLGFVVAVAVAMPGALLGVSLEPRLGTVPALIFAAGYAVFGAVLGLLVVRRGRR
jgi:hypothetical protein